MTEISALDKHACPACGAQAEWNPGKQKLVCPYCGTESPYVIDRETGKAVENDLVKALRELPDESRGWNAERRSVQCQSCRAVMVYDASRVGQNCEFCGSPALVAYSEIKAPIRPESLLPFAIGADRIRDSMRRWLNSHWLAPNRLGRASLIDTVRSLYIPYWTFDANVRCPWEAEAGHYYYVSVPYRDSQGRTGMRQERRVRWEPAAGEIQHVFDDEPVPGTHGVDLGLLRRVEPFPTKELVPYDTAFLSGHVVEHYQVVLFDAAGASQQQMHAKLEQLCAAEVPGDTYRNLAIHPVYSNQTFKHVLVPVWLLAYDYGRKKYQVVANGYTGVIAGNYPYSAWKIFFLVVAIVVVVFVLMYVSG
jgi:predicted RNA-binding Zn-ribbon protein involved in translation (DUF1610 family)